MLGSLLFGVAAFMLAGLAAGQDAGDLRQPLFPYEEKPLTDDGLKALIEAASFKDGSNLFAFDNGTNANPD